MKLIVALSCLLAVALAATVYEYDDINELIKNDRLFYAYANCFLDKGKCTPQANTIKGDIPKILETGCEECTEQQRNDVAAMINHTIKNKPEIWKEIAAKYDPSGVYRKKYEEEAKKRGVTY